MPVTSGTITAPASLRSEGAPLRIGTSDHLHRNQHVYQREHFLKEAKPELSPLHMDDGSLDFWAGSEKPATRM
jgi:hypothetical protein